ncbi:hypothetical protein ElyMa_000262100 [Elysia marginata]|uniref:Uncharacterized protein n=1 Tax=Elysia marginata TaxID=1093978 RepID=A0AAV4F3C2_9GAST|nr:hypothetical protein ElyMa_000262100 [Elysia marginata]
MSSTFLFLPQSPSTILSHKNAGASPKSFSHINPNKDEVERGRTAQKMEWVGMEWDPGKGPENLIVLIVMCATSDLTRGGDGPATRLETMQFSDEGENLLNPHRVADGFA